ncbi:MAG: ABC transporter ATP-binding protein [Patescibacteria group bacterium]
MPLIQLQNIKKIYKLGKIEIPVLHKVDLKIQEGEFLAIIGPSGSGKSTLMNIIGLLDRPTKGEYFLKGKDVSFKSGWEQARLRNQEIGFIFQTFNLLPRLNVLDNVISPMIYAKIPAKKRKEKAHEILKAVGLSKRVKHKPNELSGGEKQRVAIARALVCDPSIILADEPTGNLDSKSGGEIMEIFKKLNKQGKTIIVVTHEKVVADCARMTIRLLDGKIV